MVSPKAFDSAYTNVSGVGYRRGQRGLITGVKMLREEGWSEPRACLEVRYGWDALEYWQISEAVRTGEISVAYVPTIEEVEIERLARLMCDATHGMGSSDWIVNRSMMPVVGTGMRYLLPAARDQIPLWHDFREAAKVAIGRSD